MQSHSRVPIDIVLQVMDASEETSTSPGGFNMDQRTLCACTLVCREWRAYAQHLLRRRPLLCTTRAISGFAKYLHQSQETGTLHALHFWGCSEVLDLAPATDLFVAPPRSFSSLTALRFSKTRMTFAPKVLRMRLPFFETITVLTLSLCEFDSMRGLFDLVWACRNLSVLDVEFCKLRCAKVTVDLVNRLAMSRKYAHGCERLTSVRWWFAVF
ncbi:hypothetical protein C8Q77DRAFT_1425 [Trametes polyzona]|nr:hypothetical protein C8Q77DRAFT_1425 [Trametes polyzona]